MTRLERTVDVDVPAHRAFEQLTRYEDYPRFMEGVREVRTLDATHLHWRAEDKGTEREWESEITAQVPDQLLAWRNLTQPQKMGEIRLEPLSDVQTRVRLRMDFELMCPVEQIEVTEAQAAQRIEADLQRFKELLEAGQKNRPEAAQNPSVKQEAWLPRLMEVWEEPLSAMRRMSQEMEGVFDRFLARPLGMTHWGAQGKRSWSPAVEVARRSGQLIICADLPGLKREQVNVEICNDKLTIEGDWQAQPQDDQVEYRRSERNYGHFYRAIPLPEGIDPNGASASMHDGVLEITLPVTPQQSQGRRLDIDASQGR